MSFIAKMRFHFKCCWTWARCILFSIESIYLEARFLSCIYRWSPSHLSEGSFCISDLWIKPLVLGFLENEKIIDQIGIVLLCDAPICFNKHKFLNQLLQTEWGKIMFKFSLFWYELDFAYRIEVHSWNYASLMLNDKFTYDLLSHG